jgi:hypothetical protein
MIRKILKSDKNSLTLSLPDDLVGRVIEIIAFSIDENTSVKNPAPNEEKPGTFKEKIKAFSFNSGGYKFNRGEANDY